MEKEKLELIKKLTKKKNNSISFRISKEDDDIVKNFVEEITAFSGNEFSKSSFIRMCMFKGKTIFIGLEHYKNIMDKEESSPLKIFTTDVIEAYGAHHLINLLEKKSKKNPQESDENICRIRISDHEKFQYERGLMGAKIKTGIVNISLGDFVRFCIESELRVHKQKRKQSEK